MPRVDYGLPCGPSLYVHLTNDDLVGLNNMSDPFTITNRQLLELEIGLRQLDAVREGKDQVVALVFDPKTIYRLMKNSVVVEREKVGFDRADRAAAKTAGYFAGMQANEANARKADDYQRARAELLDQEVELTGILKIKLESLLTRPIEDPKVKPKLNAVPQSVINRLAPILEDEATDG